jgi:hypothetical protein
MDLANPKSATLICILFVVRSTRRFSGLMSESVVGVDVGE